MKNMYMKYSFVLMFMSIMSFLIGLYLLNLEKIWVLEFFMFQLVGVSCYFLMYMDWIALMFSAIILLISGTVLMFSVEYMSDEIYYKRFVMLILMFVFSMILMVMSPNLISILLGWDGLGLVSYCLVIYYQNNTAYSAGMITMLSNRIGDFGLLMSIILLMGNSWILPSVGIVSMFCMLMIILAAFTKSAQFPFSAWLPAAMSAPTPVSALVHSSTLVTAGIYLLIRFYDSLNSELVMFFMMYLSIITIFFAGLSAFMEYDMKKIVAMSTLSQLGFMMLVLAMGLWKVAYFHMLTHALFKSLLFLSVGHNLHSFGGAQDMRLMGGIGGFSLISGMGMLISSMCLFGIPFVSGFYSKELIIAKLMLGNVSLVFLLLLFLGVFFTIMYSIRMITLSMFFLMNSISMMLITESKVVMYSVFLLGTNSIFMGSVLEWLIFEEMEEGILGKEISQIIIIFIIVLLFYNIFMYYESLNYKMMNQYQLFFNSFNLSFLSSYLGLKIFLYEKSEINEINWGEMFGAVGLHHLMKKGILLVYIENSMFIMIFFMLLLYFILLF